MLHIILALLESWTEVGRGIERGAVIMRRLDRSTRMAGNDFGDGVDLRPMIFGCMEGEGSRRSFKI
jgi:hypothetical protein